MMQFKVHNWQLKSFVVSGVLFKPQHSSRIAMSTLSNYSKLDNWFQILRKESKRWISSIYFWNRWRSFIVKLIVKYIILKNCDECNNWWSDIWKQGCSIWLGPPTHTIGELEYQIQHALQNLNTVGYSKWPPLCIGSPYLLWAH